LQVPQLSFPTWQYHPSYRRSDPPSTPGKRTAPTVSDHARANCQHEAKSTTFASARMRLGSDTQ
jgi:hypothetical protein